MPTRAHPKVLFILKNRDTAFSGERYSCTLSSGLLNSAEQVMLMLIENGINSRMVNVIDNNDIDREVSKFKPTHVIIEALWVVPEKFDILTKLHPDVKWVIRNHSNIPFLANEGIAIDWMVSYIRHPNVKIAMNTEEAVSEFIEILCEHTSLKPRDVASHVLFFPNYYWQYGKTFPRKQKTKTLDVACFGAIRPLKNHLKQAVAAITFARQKGRPLRFHINSTRVEGHGDPILKNLRALFAAETTTKLVEHEWIDHNEFLKLMATMDVSMQVSYSETFNIVSADAIAMGVPVVVSPEISWVPTMFQADPNSSYDIVKKLNSALFWDNFITRRLNLHSLYNYDRDAEDAIFKALYS